MAAKFMGLEVGFIDEINAVAAAQTVPLRAIWVMGGTHRIEVVLLQQANVPQHTLPIHIMPGVGVVLMAIDALEFDGNAIEEQAPVADLNPAKANWLGDEGLGATLGINDR